MRLNRHFFNLIAGCSILWSTTACNGILEGIYDQPSDELTQVENQLIIDATSWKDWYYIDFDSLQYYASQGDSTLLQYHSTHFTPYEIPTELTSDESDTTGIYTYWFDVWGKGLSYSKKESFKPTDPQPEPRSWDIAIHRNNVRTHDAGVYETTYTSMEELPLSSGYFAQQQFQEDEWSENEVWEDQSQMLQSLIGSQGIRINKVLSSWLKVDIPPLPPAFTPNHHIFIVRLRNGKYAAIQLENHLKSDGTKCYLTLNYKYPY